MADLSMSMPPISEDNLQEMRKKVGSYQLHMFKVVALMGTLNEGNIKEPSFIRQSAPVVKGIIDNHVDSIQSLTITLDWIDKLWKQNQQLKTVVEMLSEDEVETKEKTNG